MNIRNLLTRRNMLIAIGIVGFIVIALIVQNILFGPKNAEFHFAKFSLQSPLAVDSYDNRLVFSNGRAFVAFDPQTGTSAQLIDGRKLPDITKIAVNPNGKGALFQTVNTTTLDDLGQQLTAKDLALDNAYWWYADFSTGNIRIVMLNATDPALFSEVKWSPNGARFVGIQTTAMHVFNGESLALIRSKAQSSGYGDFIVTDNNIRMSVGKNIIEEPLDTQQEPTTIESNLGSVLFSPNGEWGYMKEPVGDTGETNTYLYNFKDKKRYFEALVHEPSATWSKDGATIYLPKKTDQGETYTSIRTIDIKTLRETYINAKDQLSLDRVIFAPNSQTFIAQNGRDLYIGSTASKVENITAKHTNTIDIPNGTIEYYPNVGYYIATVNALDTSENRNIVIEAMKKTGIDTNLVQIEFSFYTLGQGPRAD